MRKFSGFPARMQFAPVPRVFLSSLLPQITDITELKVTLHIFELLSGKRGTVRFVAFSELLADTSLVRSLKAAGAKPEEALRRALELANQRGTILHLDVERDGAVESIYFLNTESEKQVVARVKSGELSLPGLKVREKASASVAGEPLPDIFALYEENIGMLTPMIAEELREAEKLYPEVWIRGAIKEAVNQNKRKWSYISAILESWSVEGKSDGAYQRDIKKTDSNRFRKQKYGHMVKR